ncbi:Nitroreductase [Desulfotomaculum arcticum]|uniref:Nitroreductase n=1 Tax=Desulfotruncus arcticus DSM 17038 TaxID=1121424 RepID=A0A1I2X8Z1_9FIRM|nr:nitroreductase family protein [Desulfotruncus arcticus]SFH09429.1 Nitroreductase [Desulfotomaculum arcticum] [Desulfotruncus arcticus DSM 17038]
MALFVFDQEKCLGCGLCARVCVEDVFTLNENNQLPRVVDEDKCIRCGHCAAACPTGALQHKDMNMQNFIPVENLRIEPEQMERFLGAKRSVRHYREKKVDQEVITRLLRVAQMAPSDNNRQEREFIVVTDPDKIAELEKATVDYYRKLLSLMNPVMRKISSVFMPHAIRELEKVIPDFQGLLRRSQKGEPAVFRGAPCIIFIYALKGNVMAKDNCLAAQHYLMLQAQAMGLGTCIIGYATAAASSLVNILNVPKNNQIISAITLGYPQYNFKRTVDRKEKEIMWL